MDLISEQKQEFSYGFDQDMSSSFPKSGQNLPFGQLRSQNNNVNHSNSNHESCPSDDYEDSSSTSSMSDDEQLHMKPCPPLRQASISLIFA